MIGSVRVAGQEVRLGWLMMGARACSVVPPVVLGRLKQRTAAILPDEALESDDPRDLDRLAEGLGRRVRDLSWRPRTGPGAPRGPGGTAAAGRR